MADETVDTATRKRKLTPKAQQYQVELLLKEFKRKRLSLSNCVGRFEELLRIKDMDATKNELEKLNQALSGLQETGRKLAELSTEQETEGILKLLDAEKLSVDRVKTSVKEWMEEHMNEDNKSEHSQASKTSRMSTKGIENKDETPKPEAETSESSTIVMTSQVIQKQSALGELLREVEECVRKKNFDVLEQKVTEMEEAFEEMRKEADGLISGGKLSEKEKLKIKIIVAEEDDQYKRIKTLLEDKPKEKNPDSKSQRSNIARIANMKEEGKSQGSARSSKSGRSGKSRSSSKSNKSIIISEEVLAGQMTRIIMRLENQMLHMSDLLEIKDVDMMKRELGVMDQMYETLISISGKLFSVSKEDKIKETNDKLAQIEQKMFDNKKLVLGWMVKMEEAEERSEISKSSRRSTISFRSNRSSNKKSGIYEDQEKETEEAQKMLEEQKEALKKQKVKCEEAIQGEGKTKVRKEIMALEDTHKNITKKMKLLQELLPQEEARKVKEWAENEEEEIYQIRQWMIKSMITKGELESTKEYTKNLKKDEEVGQQSETKVAKGFHIEQERELKEEVERMRQRLRRQMDLIKELQRTKDVEMVSRELEEIDKAYDDLVATASQLRGVMKPEEACKLSSLIDSEDAEVFQFKKQVAIWKTSATKAANVAVTTKEQKESDEPAANLDTREEKEKDSSKDKEQDKEKLGQQLDTEKKTHEQKTLTEGEIKLTEDFAYKKRRLKNQIDLIKELQKANDIEMVSRELEGMDRIYDGLSTAACALGRVLKPEEARKLASTIEAEEAEVFAMKKQVAKWRAKTAVNKINQAQNEEENKEPRTEAQATTSKKTSAQMPEEQVDKVDKSSLLKIKEPEEGRELNPTPKSGDLLKLNELMVETLKLQSAPKVEIDTFSGDPLEYNYFVETFKDVVEKLISDPRQRLVRLLKYTKGEAKELIKHCVYDENESCYETALNLLKEEYGNPFHIACAHLEKLKSWPQIKANDAHGLKTLYRFLLRCVAFQKVGAFELDSPLLLRNIQLSLPTNLQDKWTGRVGKIRKNSKAEAKFRDMLEFIEEEAKAQNDPIYSRGGFKEKKTEEKSMKVNKTEVAEEIGAKILVCQICKSNHEMERCPKLKEIIRREEKKEEQDKRCLLCSEEHDMDDCTKFSEKDARAKKDFLFTNKMCFACYGKGHKVKDCTNKRVCTICGKDHPTGLHEVTFKVHVVHEGAKEGAMCIVPVRLTHISCPEKEIQVYAMLDECSTGTFIDEDLLKVFSDDLDEKEKRPTTIKITTATNQEGMVIESCAVTGLVVKSGKENEDRERPVEIQLPVTYAKQELPMGKEDILRGERLQKWDYLKTILQDIPEVKDIPFGLLIGSNCPKALEPVQVIASQQDGPYAKRTRLGWCVVGTIKDVGGTGKCNAIKVCRKLNDVTKENRTIKQQLVLQTKVQDNAISEALQKMYRTDFIERQGEKTAMSKEDKRFVEIMKHNVKFRNGHFELPLPIKTNEIKIRCDKENCKSKDVLNQVLAQVEPEAEFEHISAQIISPSEAEMISAKDGMSIEGKRAKRRKCVIMPENQEQALQRLRWCKKRMIKDHKYKKEYSQFMAKLFNKGYARKVPPDRMHERAWYLTHHGVRHPTKGKLRVVFHCSQEKDGVSLNSKLMQGPDFMNSLLGVLLRFRKGSIPLTADIEAMYYQVHVPDGDCKFMRFYWWENGEMSKEPIECEMCVHSFGAISSKNCVIFALHQTAIEHMEEFGEEAAKALLEDFYMDDLLKSLDDVSSTTKLIQNVDRMCSAGGFNLTKFVCGNPEVLESIPSEKRADGLKEYSLGEELPVESALGVKWNVNDDTFGFRVCFKTDNGTRRGCLATISRVHDPLGIAAPFLLKGKKILQKMTSKSSSWDDPLEPQLAQGWEEWKQDLMCLKDMSIRRSYREAGMKGVVSATLHCFSDASFIGYGIACYLRLRDVEGNVKVALVLGKSRVSPLKPTTVPRLELTAATVSVRVAALLIEELKIQGLDTYYWVDNKIVLGYILNQTRRYRIFVANRVQIIEEHMQETGEEIGKKFKYVETKENPSDFASRGISPKDAEKVDIWINGPLFLRRPEEEWRREESDVEIVPGDPEVKITATCNTIKVGPETTPEKILETLERRISSWNRMVRTVVWILRFIRNTRKKVRVEESTGKELNDIYTDLDKVGTEVQELEAAERKIVWLMQEEHLKEAKKEVKSRKEVRGKKDKGQLGRLSPFTDKEGILRVGGRLSNAEEDVSFRHPAIIPKGAVCTQRLVEWHHSRVAHRGKHTTVSRIREEGWWIISAGKEVGSVVYKCVRCKWLRGKFIEQKMADLPISRTTIEPPFTYCGVDLFGPVTIKEGRKEIKRYGVLFTCFSLRAVHIEVASSLETDSFIQALRRFVARRGAVREIRSDNGTNIVGAENELRRAMKEMDHEKIRSFLNEQGGDWIQWERNTPMASHMGGSWERQIRTVKDVLTSLAKSSPRKMDEETLKTFFAEAEAIVNSRPLTLENLQDPDSSPLSPNQLLTMKSKLVSPPPGVFQKNDVYCRKRWRVAQHLANCFWTRWRTGYLQLLQSRQKWTKKRRNLQVDDVVLLKEDGTGRGHWPMARVVEAHQSKDGLVRSVTLRVKDSTLKRPVHKTVLLVAANNGEDTGSAETASGSSSDEA